MDTYQCLFRNRPELRGYVLAVIGRALVVVAGYMGNIPLMMAFTALAALGQGPWQGDMNAVIASCSEYTYLTQGKRIDGTMYSCTSLGVKIGGGMGTAVVGFVFPDIIHHYQVLTPGANKAIYLIASPFVISKFADIMQSMAPEYPIIKAEKVEPEVYRVINAILETEQPDITVAQAYLQIVLARCMGKLNLVEKSNVGSRDLIYQTVSYISANFKKKFSLEEMAKDLGVSKYVLSRLFSQIFHRNFNQYLNDARLNYACYRLENTRDSITNICLDSGFESQRTFNRVFKERYKITPREYRKRIIM